MKTIKKNNLFIIMSSEIENSSEYITSSEESNNYKKETINHKKEIINHKKEDKINNQKNIVVLEEEKPILKPKIIKISNKTLLLLRK